MMTIPEEFRNEIANTKKYREMIEESLLFDTFCIDEIKEKRPDSLIVDLFTCRIEAELELNFKRLSKQCYDRVVKFGEHEHAYKALANDKKVGLVNVYHKWLGWNYTKACKEFNIDRNYYYELKRKIENDEDLKYEVSGYIYSEFESPAEDSTSRELFYNLKKFVVISYQLKLLGYDPIEWANGENKKSNNHKGIEKLLKEAREYNKCEEFKDLELMEYIYMKNKI